MRIEQLQDIVEVDRTHSLTKAAENLYVTQPSLTIAINTLEAELGVQLFVRSKYGTMTTDEGRRVVTLAKEILERVEAIRDTEFRQTDHIEILTIPSLNSGVAADAVGVWKDTEGLSINITEGKVSDIISQFIEHNYFQMRCFCLCTMSDDVIDFFRRRFQEKKISYQVLGHDHMVCLASHADPLSTSRTVTKEAAAKLPYLEYQYDSGNTHEDISAKLAFNEGYRALTRGGSRMRVSTMEILRQLIVQGMGVSVMPSIIENKDHYFREGAICLMDFADLDMPITYYVLYNEQILLNDREKQFLAQLQAGISAWEQKDAAVFCQMNKSKSGAAQNGSAFCFVGDGD